MLFSEKSYPIKVFLTSSLCAIAGFSAFTWLPFSQLSGLSFVVGVMSGSIVALLHYTNQGTTQTQQAVKVLYVGNLPYRTNELAVRQLFSRHGQVISVRLMKDKITGKRRGFGFVEMYSVEADHAREALNDTEFQQRTLKVRDANDKRNDQHI